MPGATRCSKSGLLDIKAARLLHRRRAHVHDLARDMPDAGKALVRDVNFIFA